MDEGELRDVEGDEAEGLLLRGGSGGPFLKERQPFAPHETPGHGFCVVVEVGVLLGEELLGGWGLLADDRCCR